VKLKIGWVIYVKVAMLVSVLSLLSACGLSVAHIPSPNLGEIQTEKSAKIIVSDIGDLREGESPDRIGQGVSYWLPVSYYARDEQSRSLPVSFYIARSLSEDLRKMGYDVEFINDDTSRMPLSMEHSSVVAKERQADYLVMVKLKEGKTNFWGFLAIPFFEPVWTRVEYDSQLIKLDNDVDLGVVSTKRRETEWYFGKITVFDALFDAGLFGRRWHRVAWGSTVVSEALAETANTISAEIQGQGDVLSLR